MTPARLPVLPLGVAHDARTMPELWPVGTAFQDDDVMIDGFSMRLAAGVRTPSVRVALASSPAAHAAYVTVLVTRVEAVLARRVGRGLDVWVDAELDRVEAFGPQARLLGRASSRSRRRVHLRPDRGADALALLPGDLKVGDVLAIPCRGAIALADVERHALDPQRDA